MKESRVSADVNDYLDGLPEEQAAKILADLEALRMAHTEALSIKTLKGKIKEIIAGQHRIVFFEYKRVVYAIDAFKKQSKKTPTRVIRRAMDIYRKVTDARP